MRRLAGAFLMLLAACGGSSPTPPDVSPTSVATTAATTGATTPATSAATTGATSPATTSATSGGGASAACDALDQIESGFTAAIPDYEQVRVLGNRAIDVSRTLSDQSQGKLLFIIGTNTAGAAQAFLDGNFPEGARLQNQVLDTIPPARVALGC